MVPSPESPFAPIARLMLEQPGQVRVLVSHSALSREQGMEHSTLVLVVLPSAPGPTRCRLEVLTLLTDDDLEMYFDAWRQFARSFSCPLVAMGHLP